MFLSCQRIYCPKTKCAIRVIDSTPAPVLKCISPLQISTKCNCTEEVAVKYVDNKYIFVC